MATTINKSKPMEALTREQYFAKIEKQYGYKIKNNFYSLLCRCGIQEPPFMFPCGTFPSWCIKIRCRSELCRKKKKWAVCLRCINDEHGTKKMYSQTDILRHDADHHGLNEISNPLFVPNSIINEPMTSQSMSSLKTADYCEKWNDQYKNNDTISKHCNYYHALDKGDAMHYLVTQQFNDNKKATEGIDPIDAEMHTLIAFVGMSQSKLENTQFAKLLRLIDTKHKRDMQLLIDSREPNSRYL